MRLLSEYSLSSLPNPSTSVSCLTTSVFGSSWAPVIFGLLFSPLGGASNTSPCRMDCGTVT